jgi:hypothetical protein
MAGVVWLLNPLAPGVARAAAINDVTITSNATCANGSGLFVISNSNSSQGVVVNLAQTIILAGKASTSTIQISLAPGTTRNLGCAVQDPPPATNVQHSWSIQAAQYQQ